MDCEIKYPFHFDIPQFQQYFEIEKNVILGKGFDSTVFRVKKKNTNQYFALKLTNFKDMMHKYNFQMEIQLLHCIHQPNIVEFYGNSLDGSCILIEYMRHGNLAKFADLELRFVKPILCQVMVAVKYLHDNKVVHGDLKPENALISEQFTIKICDFGFAKVLNQPGVKLTGGSEGYTAPEILTQQEYDPKKCDIFALGVFVFVMFLGFRPFLTNHPQKEDKYWNLIKQNKWDNYWKVFNQAKPIPPDFKLYFQNLIEINPQKRYDINQCLQDPWLQQGAASYQELQEFLKSRLCK